MAPSPEEIQHYYQSHLPRYLELLRQWVSINSYTANPVGVNRLGVLTAKAFLPLGFQVERVQASNPDHGEHLFLRRPSTSGGQEQPSSEGAGAPALALVSHLDTVFSPEEERRNDFAWRPEGKRIYGPGTVDIKGGTLLIVMLLEGLQRFAPQLYERVDWLVALDAAEEVLSEGFGDQCLERLPVSTRACLVFEGGTISKKGFPLVVGRKGLATFRVQVEGRSAHSGNAHPSGANALVQLAHTIQRVHEFTDYEQNLTFNVGLARGGSATNRVPHYAEAQVEMRAFEPAIFQTGLERMLALDGGSQVSSTDGYPCRISVDLVRRTEPWPRNPGSDKLFAIWEKTGQKLGLRAIPEQRGGLSDGNHLWAHFPTIDGLGPSGGNAHCSERSDDGSKDQEYLLVDSITPKATLNLLGVLRLLKDEGS
jgi:glutamate carboxypeptidase